MANGDGATAMYRRLKGYSFDPSLSLQLDTALVNEAIFKIRWESSLKPGPVGEYLEIVDYDPASKCFYEPVDLNAKHILAEDGLAPWEGNPQFHQQMVYAVAMTTIQNFEQALGRKALWSSYRKEIIEGKTIYPGNYIQRLRIYPHALRQANAYYSPTKKALLFGYFPAAGDTPGDYLTNGIVFTCLSHDIIAHETTHALLDGMHRRFIEPSHPDTLAFHEAFADIVALFQHFSFPEVLKHQIAKTRGRLESQNLLGQLAQQFGKAIGKYGALRDAIGDFDKKEKKWRPHDPKRSEYNTIKEPHARGAILVSAVFETFLSIYKNRVKDLLRIASGGTGILPDGELHPDLVNRLANEAAKSARQILSMCIRALDYCPPVDINFGDYLRALVTADTDLVPDDDLHYRIALTQTFERRGITPKDLNDNSPKTLCWKKDITPTKEQPRVFRKIASELRDFVHHLDYLDEIPPNLFDRFQRYFSKRKVNSEIDWEGMSEREKIFVITESAKEALHDLFVDFKKVGQLEEIKRFEEITGLYLLYSEQKHKEVRGLEYRTDPGLGNNLGDPDIQGRYAFEVHSLRGARRFGPDGNSLNQVIISITQIRHIAVDNDFDLEKLPVDERKKIPQFKFRGGCTLILDLKDLRLRYPIIKKIGDMVINDGQEEKIVENERLKYQRKYYAGTEGMSLRATYMGRSGQDELDEPFALLHSDF